MSCRHVRAGDSVSILWAGCLPLLLRESRLAKLPESSTPPHGTRARDIVGYQAIGGGCCYVHGICDGEALELAEREGIQPEMIFLV
jgi:hypothetical protein